MNDIPKALAMITVILTILVFFGCSNTSSIEEGDEESGTRYALNDTCDEVFNGVRLIMSYNEQSTSFNGTVENTTDNTMERVRVEVHLSNGVELGPTTPTDLEPDEIGDVILIATNTNFNWWSVHAEVGSGE